MDAITEQHTPPVDPPAADTLPPREQPTTDPKPRPRGGARPGAGRPKGSKNRPKAKPATAAQKAAGEAGRATQARNAADRKITERLTWGLSQPAQACQAAGFAFGAAHFAQTAPTAAEMIVKASHDWEDLRNLLERGTELVSGKALALAAIVTYALPVALYAAGQQGAAHAMSPVDPTEVAGVQMLMDLPPEIKAEINRQRMNGASDDEIAARLQLYGIGHFGPGAPGAFDGGAPAGSTPPAPGAG